MSLRVVRRECVPFWGLPLNFFIYTLASSLRPYYVIVQTQKYNSEMWFENKQKMCVMHILHESHYTFAIRCWFNDLYFELFHEIFPLFHIHMELFSITSMRLLIHLTLLHPLIPIWPRNWYRGPTTNPLTPISKALTLMLYLSFSSSVLRFLYLLVLYFWFSNGIDNTTMMILRFTLDWRTISGHKPLLNIVFR